MKQDRPKGTYAAPAIEKAFEIVELLGRHPGGALVSEMATLLGRSVGELFRIVIVMERLGYLAKSTRTDRYTVTYKLLDVAYRATPAQDLVRAAAPWMQRLAEAAGQSCHLVVANAGSGLVIACEQQPGIRGFSLRIGARIDLIESCSGQILLAFASATHAAQSIAEAERERAAPIDRDRLAERLQRVRGLGYERRQSPITHGVTDISCPVFGFDGHGVAALTIPFLELIDGSQKVDADAALGLLQEAVQGIAETLGYRGGKLA